MNRRAKIILIRIGYYTLIFPIAAALVALVAIAYAVKIIDYQTLDNRVNKNSPDSEMCYVNWKMTPYELIDLIQGEAPFLKLVKNSGDYRIDALIKEHSFMDTFGAISFNSNKLFYRFYDPEGVPENYKIAVRNALKEWQNVSNVEFSELKGEERCKYYAHIEFRQHDENNSFCTKVTGAEKCAPHTRITFTPFVQPVVVTMPRNYTEYTPGSFSKAALLHEIGHALGLQHPRYYANGSNYANKNKKGLPEKEDRPDLTIMSYTMPENYVFPSKPGVYDVMAIQHLYGIPKNQTAQPATEFIPIR